MYCEETAAEAVAQRIESLRKEPKHRMIVAISDKVGIEKIQHEMCKHNGLMHKQFVETGGYRVRIDDLRRCTNEFHYQLRYEDISFKSFRFA